MEYDADFYVDWIDTMRQALPLFGVTFDPNLGDEKLSLTFWTARRREVPALPRKVVRAKEFTCPAAEQPGLAALEQKFQNGDDVNAHLSNTRLDAEGRNFNDGLLDDWRIHHFHLGVNGGRGSNCLFAFVGDTAVYFLDVLPHGVYGDVDLMQRLKDNWPQLIAGVKLNMRPTMTPPTADEIKKARRAGITPITQLPDGSVYYSPGGGVTTAGIGSDSVSLSDAAFEKIKAWQDWFDTEGITRIEAQGIDFGGKPTFKLMIDRGHFYVSDTAGKIKMDLGQLGG